MKPRKLRHRFAVASSFGAAALTIAMLGIVGSAGPAAAGPTAPAFPAACVSGQTTVAPGNGTQQFGTYPNWLPCNESVSNTDISEGSDTTLFMMQSISDLYNGSGINPFSCIVGSSSPGVGFCNSALPNATQADLFDNYAGSQELVGTNWVGSSNGIKELCGSVPPPAGTTVDYSRSSKPPGDGSACGTGNTIAAIGYAKDAVDPIDFTTIDPEAYMQTGDEAPGYVGNSFISYCQTATQPNCTSVGQTLTTAFPSTGIGPVADGWLPGDAFNCGTGGGPACSGTAFQNMSNTQDPSSTNGGATSVAYRLFCQHGNSTTPYESQIMDWGNLTNLSASANGGTAVQPGDGAPIGVPIRIIGVNTGSGTLSTFYTFAQSGILSGTNCNGNTAGNPIGSTGDVDTNAAQGQNPNTPQGGQNGSGNSEIAVENDVNQVGDFAEANWAGVAPAGAGNADSADQAIDIATSLYFESLGVYSTNPNAQVTSIEIPAGSTTGLIPSGQPSTFLANTMKANNTKASLVNELSNSYAMARTLFNVLDTGNLRASTGGFTNWLCDANSGFTKGRNVLDGGNYDTDLTNLILGQYGFQRLTDQTTELPVSKTNALADGIAGNNNGFCQARLKVSSTGAVGTNTVTLAAAAPNTVQVGWPVGVQSGSAVAVPSTTIVLSVSGTAVTLGSTTPTVGGVVQPAISSTVASSSDGGTLSSVASWTSPAAGELAVANASLFPSGGGVVQVATSGGNAYVAYTGTDTVNNLLTGVTFLSQTTPGASTTVSTGGAVTLVQAQDFITGTSGGPTPAMLYFPGKPPVLSLSTPNT